MFFFINILTYKINKISFIYIYKTLVFYVKVIKVILNISYLRCTRFKFLYKFLNRFFKYSKYIYLSRSYNINFLKSNFGFLKTKKKKLKTTLLIINT